MIVLTVCEFWLGSDDTSMLDALLGDGVPPSKLPKIVTNELLSAQRENLYKQVYTHLYINRSVPPSLPPSIIYQLDKANPPSPPP